MNEKHLTQHEVAERWGISTGTLERWRCGGIGPVWLKLGGQVRYRTQDVLAYEEECLRRDTAKRLGAGGGA
jgi:predicted site-specific integrase-resolvase